MNSIHFDKENISIEYIECICLNHPILWRSSWKRPSLGHRVSRNHARPWPWGHGHGAMGATGWAPWDLGSFLKHLGHGALQGSSISSMVFFNGLAGSLWVVVFWGGLIEIGMLRYRTAASKTAWPSTGTKSQDSKEQVHQILVPPSSLEAHGYPVGYPRGEPSCVAKWKSCGDRNVAFRNIVEHRSWSWRELFTANVLLHIKHWNDNKPTMTTHCSRAALKNKEKTYFSQPLQWLPPKKRQARWLGSLYQAVVYGIAFVH